MKPINECTTVTDLLEDPSRWTQGDDARDAHGDSVASYDPDAVCFCLLGAIDRVYEGREANHRALSRLHALHPYSVSLFNDAPGRTHAEVLGLVKRAGI